ncbi:succinate dehydrogenase subunit C [Bartonella sp. CDC_skunk]|nr:MULTISPECIES: succinate dehydrogenase, cytochrome b556 subunit [Bartonella]AQX18956.1 succinate dehydrogenase subunit C [Bartonella sp. A1379B]AQX21963.1 succinate dehydrogenase subunit C [Bartonella sp. CDC_skunk]AQX22180.1 succinate dehydrogenase / fumarate reductase cytochrome b subunit [Bartonella sp. 11B]AQX24538.1 succinate dehydrogenase / fumarate reductase cytochrome b subunit [Bartonella sp. 114]AQX25948.1 succinate dehydrogenase subunit C [Bartonella sp. Coyote22sub2]
MIETTTTKDRPRSPHLSVYRWSITMAISIAHRITGIVLYFGMCFLALWLVSIACGADTFKMVNKIYGSFPGLCFLFFYTLAGVHHIVGCVRHIVWNLNPRYLAKEKATSTAWATVFISLIVTIALWVIGYGVV